MPKPIAFPIELFSQIVKIAILDGDGKSLLSNLMLTNHAFLDLSRPLLYRSVMLPDAQTAALFFQSLTDAAPFVINLWLAFEPGRHGRKYGHVIRSMSSLRSLTTDFMDDCSQYNIHNFAMLVQSPPETLQTIRFISVNVYKSRVLEYKPFFRHFGGMNTAEGITWRKVLNRVPIVEFVIRGKETKSLLKNSYFKRAFLDYFNLTEFVYWVRVDVMWLSPDFKVVGCGRSKKITLTRSGGVWDESEIKVSRPEDARNERGWKKMVAPA